MPTILTHAAVPLAAGICLGHKHIPKPLLFAGMLAAILPDADVLAFKLGIAYLDQFGHRGASHSLFFALLIGLLAGAFAPFFKVKAWLAAGFVGISAASHGLLDMLTNGGEGVALFWPANASRYFFPWQVIEVSPIAIKRVLSARGLQVLLSEIYWVWLPLLGICLTCISWRRFSGKNNSST